MLKSLDDMFRAWCLGGGVIRVLTS